MLRLIATFFSKGYGWSDDQFLIIEIAQSWIDGNDYYGWLPLEDGSRNPQGFSMFYVGFHYLLFVFCEYLGIFNPETKMLIVRLLHAFWSALTVYYGFMITRKLSNENNAKLVGWLLAAFWIFPMISVRNLVELVSVPPLMIGLWLIIKNHKNNWKPITFLAAGFIMGIAFNIRFQAALIIGSMGLAVLLMGKWKQAIMLGLGSLFTIVVFQASIDYFVWGKPFTQIIQYVTYNSNNDNISAYPQGPWYVYLLFLSGILIPPVSFFLFAGTFNQWKKLSIITIAIFVFVAFHSYYPNKQERFVVTIIPFLMIAGVIGWTKIIDHYNNIKLFRFSKASWIFFWIINIILLLPVTISYSKKARCESMIYLSQFDDFNNFIIEDINADYPAFPPQFYLNHWYRYHVINKSTDYNAFKSARENEDSSQASGFILFYKPDDLDKRVEMMKTIYPNIKYETTIEPGYIDMILHKLNPINANEKIIIYRNTDVVK